MKEIGIIIFYKKEIKLKNFFLKCWDIDTVDIL